MSFGETKVYFDGSHYIAIPHTTRPVRKSPPKYEEIITVVQNEDSPPEITDGPSLVVDNGDRNANENNEITKNIEENAQKTQKNIKKLTKKEFFNELYAKFIDLRYNARKQKIIENMLSYFSKREYCEAYVQSNIERKQRNLICRRIRMCRKANLANFNYFCTFTYDNKLYTEQSFKKKLRTCFRHLCERKGWKYMGVWERAPKTNRLHFHGLFNIPDIQFLNIEEHSDYDTKGHKMQTSFQAEYFNGRFGRSDFKYIDANEQRLGNALAYLMKYIEKTGEKIVYSKGLPQFFISDIMDNDIVCPIGQEDKKLLLFDDFMCLDEGCLMGNVSPDVISQMRKSNWQTKNGNKKSVRIVMEPRAQTHTLLPFGNSQVFKLYYQKTFFL